MRAERRPLRVMQVLGNPAQGETAANPYTRLLVDALPQSAVQTSYFTWRSALTGSFDILHVHWPESLTKHANPGVRAAKQILLMVVMLVLRLRRIAVVRTVHNLTPHENIGWLESVALRIVDRSTTAWIVLNDTTPTPDDSRTFLVPHGHYRDWYQPPPDYLIERHRILAFGLIRAYKGMGNLVSAFAELHDKDATLHICGRPDAPGTAAELERLSSQDDRVRLDLRFVPDDALAQEIAESELVVLPYERIHNSGVALLSLSMNRPVLMRESASTRLLQDEFGPQWIRLFGGDLTADTLADALAVRGEGTVDMSRREWPHLANLLCDAYERATRFARGG